MSELERLRRRLERERAARREAETIAERTTRALYDRQQELVLLEGVAAACNEAVGVTDAVRLTLECVCRHLDWPVGQGYVLDATGQRLTCAGVGYCADEARFGAFARVSEQLTFAAGQGLAGRVLAAGAPVWIPDMVVEHSFPRAKIAARVGLHAAVAFPVVVDGRPVAVLECFSEAVHRETPELLRVLGHAGAQLARVLERVANAERLRHEATHDTLTGLPNRAFFGDRLSEALARACREDGARAAVALLDLDRFKEVNDTLGHQQGDRLLEQVGARLSGTLRKSDTIARVGGDEFGFVLPLAVDAADAVTAAVRLQDALREPFLLEGVMVQVDVSIGMALYPDDGEDAETLVRRADIAMYEAKRTHAGHLLYRSEHDPYSPTRLGMAAALRRALEAGELVLHYQPKVAVEGGEVRGVEALVRWPHPQRGLVLPDEFIPLAERTGLIKPLTTYVVRTALAQTREWLDSGLRVPVAINIAARSLLDPGFPDEIAVLLARAGVPADLLELEVTESTMLEDPDQSLKILNRLSAMGVALSIDDFGTGYSSLAQLERLPVREIKIDRGFVKAMSTDERNASIVRSTIQLGHNLGLHVVAEGVEDRDTLRDLGTLGCDTVQGYLIQRPVAAQDLTRWLLTRAGRAREGSPGRREAAWATR
jgi:diguanylate cyclase (GGDEF)-like protein